MKKYAIIAFLSFFCISVYSQSPILFSKTFEAKKKNVAVAVINNHPSYFHVLRYNKAAHDMTIERRSKPNAAIISFTPLRLDSVNSDVFNYEKLDYLWYEENYKLFFVFEKVLNSKRTVYLKIIDTLGKSSGFIELSSMDGEANVGLRFVFSKGADNTVLVVGAMSYPDGITKKAAVLYDVKSLKVIWIKKLPNEKTFSELTEGFATNNRNDLFYLHYKIKSLAVINNNTIINEYGDISIFKSSASSKEVSQESLNLSNMNVVNSATLIPEAENIIVAAHVVEEDLGPKPLLFIQKLNGDLKQVYRHKYQYPSEISEQLTFYDGSNYKEPAYKRYSLKQCLLIKDKLCFISERKDESYYKEILVWQLNIQSGKLDKIEIIPRKIFYFKDRTRFKNIAEGMITYKNDSLRVYVLEDSKNSKATSKLFKFHDFEKQTNLWGGNIVRYNSSLNNETTKNLIYANRNFDLVPLPYSSQTAEDDVFYFNEGNYEKFGFISLKNP